MSDDEQVTPQPGLPEGETIVSKSTDERFHDLVELEQEIRRRLRSNQRFLERFLDEDFVDEEVGGDEEIDRDDEEL